MYKLTENPEEKYDFSMLPRVPSPTLGESILKLKHGVDKLQHTLEHITSPVFYGVLRRSGFEETRVPVYRHPDGDISLFLLIGQNPETKDYIMLEYFMGQAKPKSYFECHEKAKEFAEELANESGKKVILGGLSPRVSYGIVEPKIVSPTSASE